MKSSGCKQAASILVPANRLSSWQANKPASWQATRNKRLGAGKSSPFQSIDDSITIGYTEGMKTAISIPDEIFEELDRIAREQHYSRSELFTIAVKEYLERLKSRKLLDALNEAYQGPESSEDTALRQRSKKYYAGKSSKDRS